MSTPTVFRRAATLLAVVLVTLGLGTDLAGARPVERPGDTGPSAPEVGPAAASDAVVAGDEAPPAGAVRPPQESVEELEVIADPEHDPGVPSPLEVILEVEADGPDATAHISVVQLQAELGEDVEDAQPVQVGLVWGDGTRALYDGGDLGRSITADHRYQVDANEMFTVHAWVTDDQGRTSTDYQNVRIEAVYDVSLSMATFQPWRYDCDGWWAGEGDFVLNYDMSWPGTSVSETEEFDLDDGESTGVFDGGIVAHGVTTSDYPTLDASWLEDDFATLDPALGLGISLRPRADESLVETIISDNGPCRIRLQYLVTTVPVG